MSISHLTEYGMGIDIIHNNQPLAARVIDLKYATTNVIYGFGLTYQVS
jgi:hypothetical protein